MEKRLAELARSLGLSLPAEWSDIAIRGICEDSRRLKRHDLFVAIPGTHHNGEAFLHDAIHKGAVAVVSEQPLNTAIPNLVVANARRATAKLASAFYDNPTRELHTIGVTGTNGKTTVCHWIAQLLEPSSTQVLSTIANSELGISNLTTPPSPIIQRTARLASDGGKRHLIVEASSAGIAQERLSCIQFDICAFTNLTSEHLHHHGSIEAYRRAKLKLFEDLPPRARAVLNADDDFSVRIARETQAGILTVGKAEGSTLHLRDSEWTPRSCRFVATIEGNDHVVNVPSGGEHSISNALVALGVGVAAGVPLSQLVERLAVVSAIPGRGEAFVRPDGRRAIVDFAHNAGALKNLLWTYARESGRLILVFGCPGDGEHDKRWAMGAVASTADLIILTSDNPKHEDPRSIAEEIAEAIATDSVEVIIEVDRQRAIERAFQQASSEDLILLAGKGHEEGQWIGDEWVPFSDAEALRRLGFVRRG